MERCATFHGSGYSHLIAFLFFLKRISHSQWLVEGLAASPARSLALPFAVRGPPRTRRCALSGRSQACESWRLNLSSAPPSPPPDPPPLFLSAPQVRHLHQEGAGDDSLSRICLCLLSHGFHKQPRPLTSSFPPSDASTKAHVLPSRHPLSIRLEPSTPLCWRGYSRWRRRTASA